MPITRPTLLIHRNTCERNIARMATKAQKSGVRFRPHFKTHQSAEVGTWFRAHGITAITVSSVSMAQYFAEHGWTDITIAIPVNWLEINTINALAGQVKLGLLVESVESAQFLVDNLIHSTDIWLEIDTGDGRTGILWGEVDVTLKIAQIIQSATHLHLAGLLTHAGRTYALREKAVIQNVYDGTVNRLLSVQKHLGKHDIQDLELSLGDTPGCATVEDFGLVHEIRPGNFVYYDVKQMLYGICTPEDIGVAVACPIISKQVREGQHQITVYGGAIHLSKDWVITAGEQQIFGLLARLTDAGWRYINDGSYVKGLSQEHGVLAVTPEIYDAFKIGDVIGILPAHSCLAVDILRDTAIIIE